MQFKDPETILFFAFRYALGRMSTAPSIVVDEILNNWDVLPNHMKIKLKQELQQHKQLNGNLGMDMDEATWKRLLDKE